MSTPRTSLTLILTLAAFAVLSSSSVQLAAAQSNAFHVDGTTQSTRFFPDSATPVPAENVETSLNSAGLFEVRLESPVFRTTPPFGGLPSLRQFDITLNASLDIQSVFDASPATPITVDIDKSVLEETFRSSSLRNIFTKVFTDKAGTSPFREVQYSSFGTPLAEFELVGNAAIPAEINNQLTITDARRTPDGERLVGDFDITVDSQWWQKHSDAVIGRATGVYGSETGIRVLGSFDTTTQPLVLDHIWKDAVNGNFNDPDRWNAQTKPTQNNAVRFAKPGPYEVGLPTGATTKVKDMSVTDGDVTLVLNGSTFDFGDSMKIDNAELTLVNQGGGPGSGPATFKGNNGSTINVQGTNGRLRVGRQTRVGDSDQGVRISSNTVVSLSPNSSQGLMPPDSVPGLISPDLPALRGRTEVVSGGELAASFGLVEGDLVNSGLVRLIEADDGEAGRLVVDGNYIQASSATLEVELLGSNNSEGLATKMRVSGIADIDGSLRITRKNGYEATVGDYFTLLEADEITRSGFAGPDVEVPGFVSVEGMFDATEATTEDVFFGVDYDTSEAGSHKVEIVALRTPQKWLTAGSSTLNSVSAPNLILIAHGTNASIDERYNRMARSMVEVAQANGVENQFDIVTLDWRDFATGTFDTKGRIFRPYESARFAQQYARNILLYMQEKGLSTPAQLDSLQAIGHSSGSFLADGFADILHDDGRSPFGAAFANALPELHVTLLDAFLSPQTGEGIPVFESGKAPLGELGDHADTLEQYFSKGLIFTDNDPVVGDPDSNFDITNYVGAFRSPISSIASHGDPILFYADAISELAREPGDNQELALQPLSDLSDEEVRFILRSFGGALAPIGRVAGLASPFGEVGSFSGIPPQELGDGDIDIVIKRITEVRGNRFSTEAVLNPVLGTWSQDPATGSFRGITQSPAAASLVGDVEGGPVNFLSFDAELSGGTGGLLSLFVEENQVLSFDLAEALFFGADLEDLRFEEIPFLLEDGDDLSLTFRLDPLDNEQITATFSNLEFGLATFEAIEVIPEPSTIVYFSVILPLLLRRRHGSHEVARSTQ